MFRRCAYALAVLLAIAATGCSSGGCFFCKALTADVAEAPPGQPLEPHVAFTPPVQMPPVAAPPPKVIVLRGIGFGFDSDAIRDEDRAVLAAAVETLQEPPGVRVEVAGFTDNVGPEDYNMGLSERRAEAVVRFLTQGGVDASQLSSIGYGVNKPVASNSTRDGRAQNRRVELDIRE